MKGYKMAKQSHKDKLFENVFQATRETVEVLREHFLIDITSKVFGDANDGYNEKSKEFFRASHAWVELNELYEYAINGEIAGSQYDTENYSDRSFIVTNGEAIVEFLTSNQSQLSQEWQDLFWMADGRFGLDGGEDISLTKLALLGKVDLRTVRNAVSAGQLVTVTKDKMFEHDTAFVENASARRWLLGRKGFKPTPLINTERELIGEVSTPTGFATFLVSQRQQIETDLTADDIAKRTVNHPSVDQAAISELESGVFALHLETVFPIADFYQVSRKDMLNCVMRVFFSEEYKMLTAPSNSI
ncbi:helix-turn-helix transcriptional regulator [Rhodoferax sp.]|uniref:helix-turn-helix domain-containing protein n=1 Tax=Rhodoferax sp. TaxID=50421 RepID=UPI002852A16A|nr:helix-turn-helix transcriptional regulator [Rhodoferax sp.]